MKRNTVIKELEERGIAFDKKASIATLKELLTRAKSEPVNTETKASEPASEPASLKSEPASLKSEPASEPAKEPQEPVKSEPASEEKASEPVKSEPASEPASLAASEQACKSFASPDSLNITCRNCKSLSACLEAMEKAESGKPAKASKSEKKESDIFGFRKESTLSVFAHFIAAKPASMLQVKQAPFNTKCNTFYDCFNVLKRGKSKLAKPIAAKDKNGNMFIMESLLSDIEKASLQETIEAYKAKNLF